MQILMNAREDFFGVQVLSALKRLRANVNVFPCIIVWPLSKMARSIEPCFLPIAHNAYRTTVATDVDFIPGV